MRRQRYTLTSVLGTMRDNSLSDRMKYERVTGNSSASMTNYDIQLFIYSNTRYVRDELAVITDPDPKSSTESKLLLRQHAMRNYHNIMRGLAADFAAISKPNQ